ncbi:MAG TPA: hypothetical protein VF518_01955, partial [Polyangia bacterium]
MVHCRRLVLLALGPVAWACSATVPAKPSVAEHLPQGIGIPRVIPSAIPFVSLEGPFWVAKGGTLIFSDVVEQNGPAAKIYRYEPRTAAFAPVPYPADATST